MVRVGVLAVVLTLWLSACATDPQQGSETLAQDLLDCIPNPTVVDLWACAAKKQRAGAVPAAATTFETKTVDKRSS